MSALPIDQRARHELREQAIWRTRIAGYAAFASATLSAVMFSMIALDTGEWLGVAPYLGGAALTFGFGAGVYFSQSQLAAGVLLVLAASTMILRVIQTGAIGGLIVGLIVLYCYFQGLRGAIDLAELEKSEDVQVPERSV